MVYAILKLSDLAWRDTVALPVMLNTMIVFGLLQKEVTARYRYY